MITESKRTTQQNMEDKLPYRLWTPVKLCKRITDDSTDF